jgi:hypothetical protein
MLVLTNADHFPWLDRPEEFFPVVDAFFRGKWPVQPTAPAERRKSRPLPNEGAAGDDGPAVLSSLE